MGGCAGWGGAGSCADSECIEAACADRCPGVRRMQCTRHNVPLHVSLNIILRILCVCVCFLCDVPVRAFEFLLVCVYLTLSHTHTLSLIPFRWGHGHSMALVSARPAPVQASFKNFVGTLGAPRSVSAHDTFHRFHFLWPISAGAVYACTRQARRRALTLAQSHPNANSIPLARVLFHTHARSFSRFRSRSRWLSL